MSDLRRWGETWEQCARRLHGGNEELEAALRETRACLYIAQPNVPQHTTTLRMIRAIKSADALLDDTIPPDSEPAEGESSVERPFTGRVGDELPQHVSTENEPGLGDDIACSNCGAVALDTGLECNECGHDMEPEIYPAQRQDAMLERREALEDLAEIEEYFDDRQDADLPAGAIRPIPNEEMRLYEACRRIRRALSDENKQVGLPTIGLDGSEDACKEMDTVPAVPEAVKMVARRMRATAEHEQEHAPLSDSKTVEAVRRGKAEALHFWTDELDHAIAQSEQGRVPEGWKLMPVEPTEDLLQTLSGWVVSGPGAARKLWARLVAAAPQPEQEGESDD